MRPVVVMLLLLANVARADVGVVVTGDPGFQVEVMSQAQRWVQEQRLALVAAPLGASTASFVDCFVIDDVACARRIFSDRSRASSLIFARIDLVAGPSRRYALTAHWFGRGREPLAGKRECAPCDEASLRWAVDALLGELVEQAGRGGGRLRIRGAPSLAIDLDGKPAGELLLERELPAGKHEIVFRRGRAKLEARSVEITEGATVDVDAPAAPPRRRSRALPAMLVVGGLAAAAVGGVFVYYGSLDGPDAPYLYRNATAIGIPLAVTGAFALGAGASLWLSAGGESANVGVAGSF